MESVVPETNISYFYRAVKVDGLEGFQQKDSYRKEI